MNTIASKCTLAVLSALYVSMSYQAVASIPDNTSVIDKKSIPIEVTSSLNVEQQSLPSPAQLLKQTHFRGPYQSLSASSAPTNSIDKKINRCKGKQCDIGELLVKFAPVVIQTNSHAQSSLSTFSTSSIPFIQGANLKPLYKPNNAKKFGLQKNSSLNIDAPQIVKAQKEASRWYRVKLDDAQQHEKMLLQLAARNDVEYVEEIQIRNLTETLPIPNDPQYPEQWHLPSTQTPEGWQWLSDQGFNPNGNRDVVVAVIDTGVDYTHPDLTLNMWVNRGETPDNGIDDDNNGFIDDVHGASVVGSDWDHKGDPMDDHGHGTHVAGIVAAKKDNQTGVVGIAPNVQIMAIKAAQYTGVLTSADIAEAIYYASENGADIINMSFGGGNYSKAEEDALAVAFGTSVLIASAGNDAKPNNQLCGKPYSISYPAAYPWVLGVMAESPTANAKGDYLAGFSNFDCVADDSAEYEVMAPGVDILSTLPNNGYAKWDGTSMAAPVVSGIAALVRTRFNEKATYSSRFIMGQLGATGPMKQGKTYDVNKPAISYHSINTLEALTNTPKPKLNYLEHYLWDGGSQGSGNNNGLVDAGETVDLAVVVRNQWGQADNVQVTLEASVKGATDVDPYVQWITDTVDYQSVGTFGNDDNGLAYDTEGLVTGVSDPFTFTISENTPNNHIINIKVKFNGSNGLDPLDTTPYQSESEFQLLVNRGIGLPSIIDSDAIGTAGGLIDTDGVVDGVVTLDNKSLYIIDKPVLVEKGITLKMGPGVQVQFWGSQPDDTYAQFRNSYLQVEGSLIVEGSIEQPVVFKPSDLFPDRMVVVRTENAQKVSFQYAELTNFYNLIPNSETYNANNITASYVEFKRATENYSLFYEKSTSGWDSRRASQLSGIEITNSHLNGLGAVDSNTTSGVIENNIWGKLLLPQGIQGSLLTNSNVKNRYYLGYTPRKIGEGNVFLGNIKKNAQGGIFPSNLQSPSADAPLAYGLSTSLNYKNHSYYQLYINGWQLADAQALVSELGDGASLATISNADEFTAISDWLYLSTQDMESNVSSTANVGYIRQADDSYAWSNGETPDYDFTGGQLYWQNRSQNPSVVPIVGKTPQLTYLKDKLWDSINGNNSFNCYSEFSDPMLCAFTPDTPVTETWIKSRYLQKQTDQLNKNLQQILDNNGYSDYAACHAAADYNCQEADEANWRQAQITRYNQYCIDSGESSCAGYTAIDYVYWHVYWVNKYNNEDAKTRVRPDFSTNRYIIEFEVDPGKTELKAALTNFIESSYQSASSFKNNAFLNRYWDPRPDLWLQIHTSTKGDQTAYEDFSGNFWGTNSEQLIDTAIIDYSDDFNLNRAKVGPRLTEAPESAYPFVADVQLLDANGNAREGSQFGAETITWKVSFNRDMNTNVQPKAWFGPDYPYTDFSVTGDWVDPRTWQGQAAISPVASDGYQYVRIQGASAAENAWLVTGDDYARYRFSVNSSGLEALTLQASAGEGYVALSWSQDDFDTLYGYNLYRSTEENGTYQRIHQSLIEGDTFEYRDENVEPGQTYYYQFKVVSSAGESDGSNIATATPVDTIAPVLSHSVVNEAGYGANVLIQAEVTDNIAVSHVTLNYRTIGQDSYISVPMSNQQNHQYRATIPGSAMLAPGVEYYIEATDGSSSSFSGRIATPHEVLVTDAPVLTALTPISGPADGGTLVTLSGRNFKEGVSVVIGSTVCRSPKLLSSSEVQCTTGEHYPAQVDITITNSDGKLARVAGGFTYMSSDVSVGIEDLQAGTGQTLDVPIRINNVSGLKAMSLNIGFDTSKLRLENVSKGPLVSSWTMDQYQPTDGSLNIAAASGGSSADGSGTLIWLEFTVIANVESTTEVVLSNVSLNDKAINVTEYSGTVNIAKGYTVGGTITHWSASEPISDAIVLIDNGVAQTVTDSFGEFNLLGVKDGSHTLRATNIAEPNNQVITSFDASLMLKHITTAAPLFGTALDAADLNGDGSVTAMEVNTVLEYAAGLSSLPLSGSPSIWQFTPKERSYNNINSDISAQDFIGYLIGDPSGNALSNSQIVGVNTNAQWFNRRVIGDKIAIDLYVGSASISAIDATLLFDPNNVNIIAVEKSDLTTQWSMAKNSQKSGELQLAIASSNSLGQPGAVLTVYVEVNPNHVSDLSLGSLLINEVNTIVPNISLLATPSDVDGDNIADYIELYYGLDPFDETDALADNDGDGLTNIEEIALGSDLNNPDTDGDGVEDGVEMASGSDLLDKNIMVGQNGILSAIRDINDDGVKDWINYVVDESSFDIALLNGVDVSELSKFSISHNYDSAALYLLASRNTDNVDEIGIFGFDSNANRYQLAVYDGMNGVKIGNWNWPATLSDVSFQALDDLTLDGVQEYAISGVHTVNGTRQLIVKDGVTKATYQTFKWPNLWDDTRFVTMTDVTQDDVPEVAMYGRHTRLDKGQLFIYDGANADSKVDVYNWNKLWSDIQLVEMDDVDGDGTIDWGQFGQRKDDGRYQWVVKKGNDKRGVIRVFSWPNDLVEVKPLLVADRTEDGIREVALFGVNPDSGRVFVRINDGRLPNERIANISWPASWEDIQVKELGDLNNDGFSEFGLLGYTKTNRTVQLIVKDGQTTTEYGRYTLPGNWEGLSLEHYDIDNDGSDDVVISGTNQGSGGIVLTSLKGADLSLINSHTLN
jgi:subtilisin family serine protease